MHHFLLLVTISAVIGFLIRKLYRRITLPPFVKTCAAVVFGSALQGLGFAIGGLVLSLLLLMLLHH
jgi:hypothetical protein